MQQELNEFFCPIELIEPMALSNEFQLVLSMKLQCDKGYVCGGGSAEV